MVEEEFVRKHHKQRKENTMDFFAMMLEEAAANPNMDEFMTGQGDKRREEGANPKPAKPKAKTQTKKKQLINRKIVELQHQQIYHNQKPSLKHHQKKKPSQKQRYNQKQRHQNQKLNPSQLKRMQQSRVSKKVPLKFFMIVLIIGKETVIKVV